MSANSIVKAGAAKDPFDGYDSALVAPSDGDPVENASLILELKIRLNFVDIANMNERIVLLSNGNWYARDADGWLFPIVNWTQALRQQYSALYRQRAEQFWSEKFVLFTPVQTGVL